MSGENSGIHVACVKQLPKQHPIRTSFGYFTSNKRLAATRLVATYWPFAAVVRPLWRLIFTLDGSSQADDQPSRPYWLLQTSGAQNDRPFFFQET